LVLFLLQPEEHDVGVGNPLKPGEPALDFPRIWRASRARGDALGPARRMAVFLIGQTNENVSAPGVALARRKMPVGRRCLDLAAPHRLDRREIDLVDRHHPTSRSKNTIVAMPAAMSSTWRSALASIFPRWRSGIRSDMAMYKRLADDSARTNGRMP